MPALCIQERTEPRLEGSSGSSFRWSPPRGRVSCAGNIRTRSSWAPPTAKDRFPPRLWASQLSPTRRHQEPPGAQRYTEFRSLSARSPLGCSLSESGSPGADAVPSPPGARGGEMEGFPRGLRAGEQTESGARTLARRRPRGALWRLPSTAVVGGGGGRAPRELPALPPPASPRPPAAPARGADYHPRGGDCGRRARRRRRWRPGRQQQQQSRVPGKSRAGAGPADAAAARPPSAPAPRACRCPGRQHLQQEQQQTGRLPPGPGPRASPPRSPPPAAPRGLAAGPGHPAAAAAPWGAGAEGREHRQEEGCRKRVGPGDSGPGEAGAGREAGRGAARDVTSSGEERPGWGRGGGADPGESVAGLGATAQGEAAGERWEASPGRGRRRQGGLGAARLGSLV